MRFGIKLAILWKNNLIAKLSIKKKKNSVNQNKLIRWWGHILSWQRKKDD